MSQLQDIQRNSELMAEVIAGGLAGTERDANGKVEEWRVAQCRRLAEKLVRLVAEDLEMSGPVQIVQCSGEFRQMDGGRYFECPACGAVVVPLGFHEARRARFGPHWWDEAKQRVRFDAPPTVETEEDDGDDD